jgi:hypothetical protein
MNQLGMSNLQKNAVKPIYQQMSQTDADFKTSNSGLLLICEICVICG